MAREPDSQGRPDLPHRNTDPRKVRGDLKDHLVPIPLPWAEKICSFTPLDPISNPREAQNGVGNGLWDTERGRGSGDSSCRCKYSRDSALTVMQIVTSREAAADLHDNGRECHPPTASPAFPALGAGAGVAWVLGCCPCPNPRALIETFDWEGGSHKFKRVN